MTQVKLMKLGHIQFATAFVILTIPLLCDAQELSCKRLFMSKSAKAVCGSPELTRLDAQLGSLSRRAEILDPNYSEGNSEYWSSLKACDGDVKCISDVYAARISQLQKTIESARPLTDEESKKVQTADRDAETWSAGQQEARDRIVAKSAEENAKEGAEDQTTHTSTQLSQNKQTDTATEVTSEVQPSTPNTVSGQGASGEPASTQSSTGGGVSALLSGAPWWVWPAGFGILTLWVYFARKKCPKCGKRGTSKETSRDFQGSSTEYRDVSVPEEHKDRNGQLIKTVHRTEQRAYKVSHYLVHYRCGSCANKWSESQTR